MTDDVQRTPDGTLVIHRDPAACEDCGRTDGHGVPCTGVPR
jgi:glycerophosphoryl diester phosphodiesterase